MKIDIIPYITINPKIIASARTSFMATIGHNVPRISKQIVDLQNRL